MKLFGVIFLSALAGLSAVSVQASDPAKVEYAERNTTYAPAASVTPAQRTPQPNRALQDRRVTPATIDKKDAAVGALRAPIDLSEAHEKNVIGKDSHRPDVRERELSAYDHRESGIKPADQLEKPPLVTRYQTSLATASSTNMSRFPALGQATGAHINRFVFRKNEPAGVAPAAVVSAAGGSQLLRTSR